jgi:hypothetical protein
MSTATSLLLYRRLLDGLLNRLDESEPPSSQYKDEFDRPQWLRVTDYAWLVQTLKELTEADPAFREILAELKPKTCAGCTLTFTPHRPEQIYHDAYCRARANTRKTYYRQKGEKDAD